MSFQDSIIFIVGHDPLVRERLLTILASRGTRTAAFDSAEEYAAFSRPDLPGCLILDVHVPDTNSREFRRQIDDGHHPPVVFIIGQSDIPSSLRAIKLGAVDFLMKPFSESELTDAVHAAIARDKTARLDRTERATLQQYFSRLTPREGEVLPLVVSGLLNKQAAAVLGISEVTLQIHRSRIMHKMQAASFADLVRIADRLQISMPVVSGQYPQFGRYL